ncbi:MAG: RNA polymerase sigma factor [Planctomycetota bacterium]
MNNPTDPSDIFDEWLVLRCQGGDADALTQLFQRWHSRLLGLAIRLLHDRNEADDACQLAWIAIVKQINRLDDPRRLRSWMFRIVANKCTDTIRKRSRQRQREKLVPQETLTEAKSGDDRNETTCGEKVESLRRLLPILEAQDRQILKLHYLDQCSINAIANQLSIPTGTVKSRLYHARQHLKEALLGENHE